jgi:ABC-type Zn2+ transport system substrate-binding protein/surface adhesin
MPGSFRSRRRVIFSTTLTDSRRAIRSPGGDRDHDRDHDHDRDRDHDHDHDHDHERLVAKN